MTSPTTPTPSPLFATVARAGLPFGLVLALTAAARLASLYVLPQLILLYYIGLFVTPVVAYRSARFYRDSHFAGEPFRWAQGFSYTVLLHALGGILALLPQYFYFKHALPSLLEQLTPAWEQVFGAQAGARIEALQTISTLEWLWADYSLTIFLGLAWGIIVGLALRRN